MTELSASAVAQRPIRVLLADDDGRARRALRAQLAVAADIDVVGEANDGALALQLARWLRPDVALFDDDMPVMGGPELARGLAKELLEVRAWLVGAVPSVGVVVYTLNTDVFEEARRLGAACVAKDASYEVLLRAIREAPSLASVR